jgi:hypothetical protein
VKIHNPGGAGVLFWCRRGIIKASLLRLFPAKRGAMPAKKPASLRPEIEKRIAAVERMTSVQLEALSIRLLSEILKEKITLKEARAINRAVGRRIEVIENELVWPADFS